MDRANLRDRIPLRGGVDGDQRGGSPWCFFWPGELLESNVLESNVQVIPLGGFLALATGVMFTWGPMW